MDLYDVLVIGGGLAGWRAAEAATKAGASVALVANGAGNSPEIHALNVPVGPGDSVDLFIADTLRSGRGACDRALVETLCRESVALADEFPWDRGPDGSLDLLQPVGCSVPRCVSIGHHIGAWALAKLKRDLAGKVEVVRGRIVTLRAEDGAFHAEMDPHAETAEFDSHAEAAETAEFDSHAETAESAEFDPHAENAENAECSHSSLFTLHSSLVAKTAVLATGGWCGKYAFSDNPPELRGDGIDLAVSLGAAVRDMDAVQYEPTVALAPDAVRGIPVITTMLHEGATFRNRDGAEFLPDKHANKDELSRAILAEIAAGRGVSCLSSDSVIRHSSQSDAGVWFDATGVPAEVLRTRYADTVRRYAAAGVDVTREPMLVAPAPHTSLGGVVIDARCRVLRPDGSPVPGLFAAGEVTGGVHGLNRIGGNAGTEVLVFGKIAGTEAARHAAASFAPPAPPSSIDKISGVVVRGHGVASGRAGDPRFPDGTIAMQIPFFRALGLDLGGFHPGTINIDCTPLRFRPGPGAVLFERVKWHLETPAETFSFARATLVRDGARHSAWIYYPHPETKPEHFQPGGVAEVIAPLVPDLAYGDRVILETTPDQAVWLA